MRLFTILVTMALLNSPYNSNCISSGLSLASKAEGGVFKLNKQHYAQIETELVTADRLNGMAA